MLGVRILTPRTGRIGVRSIVSSGIATGVTRRGAAVLGAAIIAPISIAHAMAGVFVIRIAAVPAIGFAPVLTAGIFLPASIRIAVAGCVDGFVLGLTAGTRIASVAIAGAGSRLLTLQHPRMAAAVRAGTGTVTTSAVTLIGVSAKVLDVVAE